MIYILAFVAIFSAVALLLSFVSGKKVSVPKTEEKTAATEEGNEFTRLNESSKTAVTLQKTETFSAIPWLNDKLKKMEIAERLRLYLAQASLSWMPGKFLLSCLFLLSAGFFVATLRTHSIIISLLIGIVVGLLPAFYVVWKRQKRFAAFEANLPETLDLIVSALRAGHSLNAALGLISRESTPPISTEFQICFSEQNYGLELREALGNLLVRVPLPDLQIAVTAILIQKETGGNLAEVLNNTAEVIRERFRLRKQVTVHTAHGRMSAYVVTALPIILFVVMYLINPSMESLLWTDPLGRKVFGVAAGMMVLGAIVIQKIVRIEV